jgi:hypothetical protein
VLPLALTILMKAALLARSSGAAEIGIDELVAVTADDSWPPKPGKPSVNDDLIPSPKYDVRLSPVAAVVLDAAGGLDNLSIEQLRSALIKAQRGV